MSSGKVLLTGAAGFIGRILRDHWGDRFDLRLADIRPIEDAGQHESVAFDIADYDAMKAACQDVATVFHLAADPSMQAEFYDSLLGRNVIGTYNAFQAAHESGCKRVVFQAASTPY